MRLNLKKLKSIRHSQEVFYAEEPGNPELLKGIGGRFLGLVKTEITVKNEDAYFTGTGQIWALLELECIRCLCPVEHMIQSSWDLILVDEAQKKKFAEAEDVVFIYDDCADITSMIEEVIVTELPFRALCSAECKGLCAGCGRDLNAGNCDCNHEIIDPRWEKLMNLRKEGI